MAGQLAERAAEILDAPLLPGTEAPWLDALRAKLDLARERSRRLLTAARAPAAEAEPAAPANPGTWAEVPARLRASATPFAGRDVESSRLQAALAAAQSGSGQVVLVGGDAGIGKTRLCSEFAATAVAAGAVVAYGRSDEDLGLPYQPFVEVFTSLLEVMPQDMVESYAMAFGGALARLAPVLERRVSAVVPAQVTAAETERHVVFDAARAW